jgi:23S rRNA pseudouridine955/2504/2580 synthase
MREYKISKEENNIRLDKYVKKVLKEAPLSMIYKLFRKKDIKVNGKPANDKTVLQEGDTVRIYLVEEKYNDVASQKKINIKQHHFKVVYEDENILIVSKPIGMVVQDAENVNEATLTDEVRSYLYEKKEYNPSMQIGFDPSPAHRIDRNTSGLVIYGKNMESLQDLNDMFKRRVGIHKTYLALVCGKVDKEGKINKPLNKDEKDKTVRIDYKEGKTAITAYAPVLYNDDFSLVEVKILTGRTHQIRVHFNSIGHSLIGDKKYGDFRVNSYFEDNFKWKNQFLHAYKIDFEGIEGKLSYLNNKSIVDAFDESKEKVINLVFNVDVKKILIKKSKNF